MSRTCLAALAFIAASLIAGCSSSDDSTMLEDPITVPQNPTSDPGNRTDLLGVCQEASVTGGDAGSLTPCVPDRTEPTVDIAVSPRYEAFGIVLGIRFTWSEPVSNFTADKVTLSGNSSVRTPFSRTSASVYSMEVSLNESTQPFELRVTGGIQDASGNKSRPAVIGVGGTASSFAVSLDNPGGIAGIGGVAGGGQAGEAGDAGSGVGGIIPTLFRPAPLVRSESVGSTGIRLLWEKATTGRDVTHFLVLARATPLEPLKPVGERIPAIYSDYSIVLPRTGVLSYAVRACNATPILQSAVRASFNTLDIWSCATTEEIAVGTLPTVLGTPFTAAGQRFGEVIAVSGNGQYMAVGAPGAGASGEGEVTVFARRSGAWVRTQTLSAAVKERGDLFGAAIALSSDGTTLLVGAPGEDSNGTSATNNAALESGAAYIFARSGESFSQVAYLKATSSTGWRAAFGSAVALSADGVVAAVGAPGAADQPVTFEQGRVLLYKRGSNGLYSIATSTPLFGEPSFSPEDHFGRSIALAASATGYVLAVGAPADASTGRVYAFTSLDSGLSWFRLSVPLAGDADVQTGNRLGASVALSQDARMLAAGAPGVVGNSSSGRVFIFSRQGSAPTAAFLAEAPVNTTAYVGGPGSIRRYPGGGIARLRELFGELSRSDEDDLFGQSVALTGTGEQRRLVVGAPTGFGANCLSQSSAISGRPVPDDCYRSGLGTATPSGTVVVLGRSVDSSGAIFWQPHLYIYPPAGEAPNAAFGTSVAVAADTQGIVVGSPSSNRSPASSGAVYIFE